MKIGTYLQFWRENFPMLYGDQPLNICVWNDGADTQNLAVVVIHLNWIDPYRRIDSWRMARRSPDITPLAICNT